MCKEIDDKKDRCFEGFVLKNIMRGGCNILCLVLAIIVVNAPVIRFFSVLRSSMVSDWNEKFIDVFLVLDGGFCFYF